MILIIQRDTVESKTVLAIFCTRDATLSLGRETRIRCMPLISLGDDVQQCDDR